MYRTRTTCFYCGKSRLVSSHTPVVRYFKCPNCDAENRFDERGEIEDFAPESPPEKENVRYGYRASPKRQHTDANSETICCRDCLRNQALIVQNLAEYLPDENHPDYDNYVANIGNYRRQTEERYPPLCKDCAPKVQARIQRMNYMAKSASLAKLLDSSAQMLQSRALHSQVVWGPWLCTKVVLWAGCGAVFYSSILLLLFWHLCGAMYPMHLESSGQLSLEAWKVCLRQSRENFTLGSSCYAVSTDWVRNLFPWVLLLLPWNYKWLSVKTNPGAYVLNLMDYYKCQGFYAVLLSLDWLIFGRIREEKSFEKFHTIFLVLEIMLLWVSMTSLRVSYPTKITFKETPLDLPQAQSEQPLLDNSLDLPPSPEPPRSSIPANRSFGFVPGKTTNVQTRSQAYAANGASASFNSSFDQSSRRLEPSPFQSTSNSQTSTQPTAPSAFWGSQPQASSYSTARQSSYDPDAMDVDMEPPSSQVSNFGLSGPSFQGHRFGTTTPQDTPVKQPFHRRTYSNSSDEGNDDLSPIKSRKMIGGGMGLQSYAPLPAGQLNANLFADKTGLENLFEAAARLEDPIPVMSKKAVAKMLAAFAINTFRLVVLSVAITVQMEFIGLPSALAMCVVALVGPFWRMGGYYLRVKGNPTIRALLNRHPRLLISVGEFVFAVGHVLFTLALVVWAKMATAPVAAEIRIPEEPVNVPIADVFSLSTVADVLNPVTTLLPSNTPSPLAPPPMSGVAPSPLLITQATVSIFATKLFFVVLLVHQAFELVLTLVRRHVPSLRADGPPAGTAGRQRRTSRDYGISHAVAQPIKREPSPLSSFKVAGHSQGDPFGGLSLGGSGGSSGAMVVRRESPDQPSSRQTPYFGMSTSGVRVPPSGSSFGEGMTLRDRGVAANKKGKTAW